MCRYNITWTVDSHTPIEEFKLYFRRLPQGHDIDNSIDQRQPNQHHSIQSHRNNYNNLLHLSRNDWRDVVLPSVPPSHHYTQGMSYMIRGLDPDQQYEARVQARYVNIAIVVQTKKNHSNFEKIKTCFISFYLDWCVCVMNYHHLFLIMKVKKKKFSLRVFIIVHYGTCKTNYH